MPSSTSKSKPKASEVAADTRRNYIPMIRSNYGHIYQMHSQLHPYPTTELVPTTAAPFGRLPTFYVRDGDPIYVSVNWAAQLHSQNPSQSAVPFICSANDKRPGGDWETGVVGCEERLCRRSTLSATLATPAPGTYESNFPIPILGGILSEHVVVFRGPADRYERLPPEEWSVLPVCSVPPVRWPKLTQMGTKYSFAEERAMVKDKIRAALLICAAAGYTDIVIGDFGLGNGYRNPPQEMAELWREVILWDKDVRGRFKGVCFVFEDAKQSTAKLIIDDLNKKSRSGKSGASGAVSVTSANTVSDRDIFSFVFSSEEIQRFLTEPDPRYGLGTLMSPN